MKAIITTVALTMGFFVSAMAQYSNTQMKLGQKAPDLAYPNPEGKTMKLSEINKGRYVILDFWASWCGPCRHANPALVKIYKTYSGKKFKNAKSGFTVVSFSLDMSKENWKSAIARDGLVWPYHMSDLNPTQWQSAVVPVYGIQYIPQAFLLDPNGKIIGKYNSGEKAEEDLKKFVVN